MPLYPVGFNPNVIDVAAIAETMRPALYAWFSAHIQIVDPNVTGGQVYKAKEDSGGAAAPEVLYDSGERGALIQTIRAATPAQIGDQNTAVAGIRFQIRNDIPADVQLRSGLQVLVLNPGEDPELSTFTYVLKDPIDSSLAWGKILEARVVVGGRE